MEGRFSTLVEYAKALWRNLFLANWGFLNLKVSGILGAYTPDTRNTTRSPDPIVSLLVNLAHCNTKVVSFSMYLAMSGVFGAHYGSVKRSVQEGSCEWATGKSPLYCSEYSVRRMQPIWNWPTGYWLPAASIRCAAAAWDVLPMPIVADCSTTSMYFLKLCIPAI